MISFRNVPCENGDSAMSAEMIEQGLLERLSVFAGSFTLDAAQTVCVDETLPRNDVPRLLSQLVRQSLVAIAPHEQEQRYRLPEAVRSAVYARLAPRGHARQVYLRLVDYLFELAKQGVGRIQEGGKGLYGWEWGPPIGPEGTAWFNRQEQELGNLRAALQWLVKQGEVKRGLALVGLLLDYWQTSPERLDEGYLWHTRLLETPPAHQEATPSQAERAEALHNAAGLTLDAEIARELYEASLAIYRDLGHQGQMIHLAGHVVEAMCDLHDYSSARALLEEELVDARTKGKKRLVNRLTDRLARVLYDNGDLSAARTHFEEALAMCHSGGDEALIPHVLLGLGRVAAAQEDFEAAAAAYQQALMRFDRDDYQWGIVLVLEGLASVATGRGDTERAWRLFGAADGLRETIRTTVPFMGEPVYDWYAAQARAALNGTPNESAWSSGRLMTRDQTIAYALE
jgi:tetratricopeptide (TPR) repeat protein